MIDTHAHVWIADSEFPWQPSLASVPVPDSSATDDDLLAEMREANVSRAVLVQPAAYGWDNRYVARSVARAPSSFSGVCLVDPHSASASADLRRWTDEHGFHGVRINLLDDDGVDWLLSPPVRTLIDTVAALALPLLIQPQLHHVETVARMAESHPDLVVVVDYLGPEACRDPAGQEAIWRFARVPNVVLKLLCIPSDSRRAFPHPDLLALYRTAIDVFGPERIVLGTDFPYVRAQLPYGDAIAWLRSDVCADDPATLGAIEATSERLWPRVAAA